MKITTVGIDLAKNVFQVHGIDAGGKAVLRKRLRRAQVAVFFGNLPPCAIGMEACASAHHWARTLQGRAPRQLLQQQLGSRPEGRDTGDGRVVLTS